jgi:hypothetical protein
MNDELVAQIERELLGWPGVSKETGGGGPGRSGFRVPPATGYRFGRRQIGHVHHNEAGLPTSHFPRGSGGVDPVRAGDPPPRLPGQPDGRKLPSAGALQTCPGPCNSSA